MLTFVIAASALAQEGIKPEKIAEIKSASVFIRNQSGTQKSSGSGFVVSSTADSLLIATNAHVVAPDDLSTKVPSQILPQVNKATITTLFDSGSPNERSAKAEVVSFDPVADIAILKVKTADVKNPPKALKTVGAKALAETSTVYTFGFPFGDKLATDKGPAITVGKASVSSLRTDDLGKLTTIQIDGNLNPGNSGGPVLDVEGVVIGVATATIRDSQGIGLIVPVAEVNSMLSGKVVLTNADYKKQTDGKVKVVFEAFVSNPSGKITSATLNYIMAEATAEKPKAEADLSKLPGAKSLTLKLDGPVAKGELLLDKAEGQLFYNTKATGSTAEASANVIVSLPRALLGSQGIDADATPPAGWKEVGIDNKFITIWVPEKTSKQSERTRTIRSGTISLTINATTVLANNGLIYLLERASLRLPVGSKLDTKALRDSIVRSAADDIKGKVAEESDAKMGNWPCKEYVIKAGATTSIIRVLVTARTVYIVQVQGANAKVMGDDGYLFLNSFRTHPKEKPDVAVVTPGTGTTTPGTGTTTPGTGSTTPPNPKPVTPTTPKPATPTLPAGAIPKPTEASANPIALNMNPTKILPSGESQIIAGVFDPVFKDFAPEGGMMVGMQIGLGKFINYDIVVAARPIYRTDGKESFGIGRGASTNIKTVMAKEGYAVGGVLVASGMGIDGLAVVFMKIDGEKLDPKDSYQSPYYGNPMKTPDQLITGDGLPIIGLGGKQNARTNQFTGIGLILNTLEANAARLQWSTGLSSEIIGGVNDPVYRDILPEGGYLIGLEIGTNAQSHIKGIKPIFLAGAQESTGDQHGTQFTNTTTIKAKEGYAIGAVTIISGLCADGLSVTFMKIEKNGLNPKVSYESEWVGFMDKRKPRTLSGLGKPIIGITGKNNDRENTGFGLVIQTDAKK
jgi:S1-C subfamily serine protease